MSVIEQVKAGHAERAAEQQIPAEGEQPRQWMVYGVAIVSAKDRREATDKAKAGQINQPFTVMDDVGGFYEPEPYNWGDGYAYTNPTSAEPKP